MTKTELSQSKILREIKIYDSTPEPRKQRVLRVAQCNRLQARNEREEKICPHGVSPGGLRVPGWQDQFQHTRFPLLQQLERQT